MTEEGEEVGLIMLIHSEIVEPKGRTNNGDKLTGKVPKQETKIQMQSPLTVRIAERRRTFVDQESPLGANVKSMT